MSFDKQSYNNAYNKQNYSNISFRINKTTEKAIAERLKDQPNVKEYICSLIMADIKKAERKAGYVRAKTERKTHLNYSKYPFEVLEFLANNDRYTVGYAESADAAAALAAQYMARYDGHGPVKVYERFYDDTIKAWTVTEVVTWLNSVI